MNLLTETGTVSSSNGTTHGEKRDRTQPENLETIWQFNLWNITNRKNILGTS